eukprot:m.9290 g.9290  ORF g.9290 m.9290 type:complete len:130 (-) comp9405_c0_seq1:128-517(-)
MLRQAQRTCHLLSATTRSFSTTSAISSAPTPMKLGLLQYNYVDNMLEKRQPHRAAHLAYASSKNSQGDIIMGGALNEPVDKGIIVCTSVTTAEAFAANDPYVLNGLVSSYEVREYNVVVGSYYDTQQGQ